ncbi:MAG: tRNA-(ms[2]io[6]A)-hydroxylase [Pseudomonadota bacterium]
MAVAADALAPVTAFLPTRTPQTWIDAAVSRLPELLLDHANCELKAASTALAFIYRYPERTALCSRMSKLAREELRHFEQVRKLMDARRIPFEKLSASRYAGSLRERVRAKEPERLLDSLLIGAIIEARSCERFAALAPRLPDDLQRFYSGLLASEARHFENYIALARSETGATDELVDARLSELLRFESTLVETEDTQFRFHSGRPA